MIKLIILDVDGCLSEGKITYTNEGVEIKNFNVKDGFAIEGWQRLGNKVAIITGRNSKIVENRAKELKIEHYYQGVKDKKAVLDNLLLELGITLESVAAIGDDLNDYRLLKSVKRSFTPANGVALIQEAVDTVLSKDGGEGAVREMIEILMQENGQYDQFLNAWL
ncbi:MAG: HAD hydrolase family protein [Epsilonproteobacteria bacterium]|nr:HAD hydrolase family protein [Campylobacterota bacterium]